MHGVKESMIYQTIHLQIQGSTPYTASCNTLCVPTPFYTTVAIMNFLPICATVVLHEIRADGLQALGTNDPDVFSSVVLLLVDQLGARKHFLLASISHFP